MEVARSNYLPGDPRLIDNIVYELKSQGIFDNFRKECISDVDTKPAYQNLRQRVEGSVMGFLRNQQWSPNMNKNQVREMLRKTISESGFLETGVERIVDQVVNPKINSIFFPQVENIFYKFLGIEKLTESSNTRKNFVNTSNNINITLSDLLPNDLEAVSPENETFDKNSSANASNDSQKEQDKIEEDDSPPFEALEENTCFPPQEEISVESHLSGISDLTSHDSNQSIGTRRLEMDISNEELQNSNSFDNRLCIQRFELKVYEPIEEEMEISEDSNYSKAASDNTDSISKTSFDNIVEKTTAKDSVAIKSNTDGIHNADSNHSQKSDFKHDSSDKYSSDKHYKSSSDTDSKHHNDKHDKQHKSNNDKDSKYHSSDKHSSDKQHKSSKDKHTSRDRKSEKDKKPDNHKSDSKYKSQHSSKRSHDREKDDGDSKSSSKKSDSKADKERKNDKHHHRSRHSSSSHSRDKNSKNSVSEHDEHRSNTKVKDSSRSKSPSKKMEEVNTKEIDKTSSKRDGLENLKEKERDRSDNKESSSSRKHSSESKSSKDRSSRHRSHSKSKSDSRLHHSSRDKGDSKNHSKHTDQTKSDDVAKKSTHKHDDKNLKSDKHSMPSKKDKHHKDRKESKSDDHHNSKEKKFHRRSTDRDSSDGRSGTHSSSSSFAESYSSAHLQKANDDSSKINSGSNSGESGNSDRTEVTSDKVEQNTAHNEYQHVKLIKPKFASNIFEARRLLKIRKKISKLEKQNQMKILNNSGILHDKITVNNVKENDVQNENGKNAEMLLLNNDITKSVSKRETEITKKRQENKKNSVRKFILKETSTEEKPADTMKSPTALPTAIISKESWDAVEAKLNSANILNVDYNSYVDVSEDIEESELSLSHKINNITADIKISSCIEVENITKSEDCSDSAEEIEDEDHQNDSAEEKEEDQASSESQDSHKCTDPCECQISKEQKVEVPKDANTDGEVNKNCLYLVPEVLPETQRYFDKIANRISLLEEEIARRTKLLILHMENQRNKDDEIDVNKRLPKIDIVDVNTDTEIVISPSKSSKCEIKNHQDVHNNNKRKLQYDEVDGIHENISNKDASEQGDTAPKPKKMKLVHNSVEEVDFSLPLSPADSENSISSNSEKQKPNSRTSSKRIAARQQSYTSDDLYKPRLRFASSRRRVVTNSGSDAKN